MCKLSSDLNTRIQPLAQVIFLSSYWHVNIFFIFYIIHPVISILHLLSFFYHFYWSIRLFDFNEKQKYLNRPTTGEFTYLLWRRLGKLTYFPNFGKRKVASYSVDVREYFNKKKTLKQFVLDQDPSLKKH